MNLKLREQTIVFFLIFSVNIIYAQGSETSNRSDIWEFCDRPGLSRLDSIEIKKRIDITQSKIAGSWKLEELSENYGVVSKKPDKNTIFILNKDGIGIVFENNTEVSRININMSYKYRFGSFDAVVSGKNIFSLGTYSQVENKYGVVSSICPDKMIIGSGRSHANMYAFRRLD